MNPARRVLTWDILVSWFQKSAHISPATGPLVLSLSKGAVVSFDKLTTSGPFMNGYFRK